MLVMETFGKRLKRLREGRQLKSTELAKILKISLPYQSQLEADLAVPSEQLAKRIAQEFGQDAEELLFLARRVPEQLSNILHKFPNATLSFLGGGGKTNRRSQMERLATRTTENDSFANNPPTAHIGGASRSFALPPREETALLTETFEVVRPSIVAFASKLVKTELGGVPVFPEIIGTGFVVDSRGIVVTNSHVVQALQALPPHPVTGAQSAVAIVWANVEAVGEGRALPIVFADVKGYSTMTSFMSTGPFYGEALPDIAFVQLNVRDIPALSLSIEPDTLRMGLPVATAGFPLGSDPLVVFGKVTQLTPFLRQGIVSSLYPFPCPHPHGFTIDIMSQGGASGSPIFLTNRPTVVGMVHAGFPGANVTIAIPSNLISQALAQCANGEPLDLKDVPTLESWLKEAERSGELKWDSFIFRGSARPK